MCAQAELGALPKKYPLQRECFCSILSKNCTVNPAAMNRKTINALLLIFVLLILYNTLLPFDFHVRGRSLQSLCASVEWRLFSFQGRWPPLTDIAGNILLFMPLGFLFYLRLQHRRSMAMFIMTAGCSFLLSSLIEFLQLFIPARTSSLTDIFNNTLGALIGASVSRFYHRAISEKRALWMRTIASSQPATVILVAAFSLQLLAALFPFTVSITVSDLKDNLKQMNLVPFANHSLGSLLFHHSTRLDLMPFNWFNFTENVLFWAGWGYVAGFCYSSYWCLYRNGARLAIVVAFLPGVLLEFAQLFIVSRHCDINDTISNWIGALSGMLLYSIFRRSHRASSSDSWQQMNGAVILYSLFVLFAGLQPFDFLSSFHHANPSIDPKRLIPFYSYFEYTNIWNIVDVAEAIIRFYPVGLYFSYRLIRRNYSWKKTSWAVSASGLATGLLIEFSQTFSPTRVADITDALLYGIGGLLGSLSLRHMWHNPIAGSKQ